MPVMPRVVRRFVPVTLLLLLVVGPADAADTDDPAAVPVLAVWCSLEGFHDDARTAALAGSPRTRHEPTSATPLPALPPRTSTDGARSGGTERAGHSTDRPGIPGANA
jgi:hypothetical protein